MIGDKGLPGREDCGEADSLEESLFITRTAWLVPLTISPQPYPTLTRMVMCPQLESRQMDFITYSCIIENSLSINDFPD